MLNRNTMHTIVYPIIEAVTAVEGYPILNQVQLIYGHCQNDNIFKCRIVDFDINKFVSDTITLFTRAMYVHASYSR